MHAPHHTHVQTRLRRRMFTNRLSASNKASRRVAFVRPRPCMIGLHLFAPLNGGCRRSDMSQYAPSTVPTSVLALLLPYGVDDPRLRDITTACGRIWCILGSCQFLATGGRRVTPFTRATDVDECDNTQIPREQDHHADHADEESGLCRDIDKIKLSFEPFCMMIGKVGTARGGTKASHPGPRNVRTRGRSRP